MALKRGRKSLRQIREDNNRYDAFMAAMAGKPPQAQNVLTPKRQSAPRKKPEASVNKRLAQAIKAFSNARLWRNNRGVAQMGDAVIRFGVGPNGAGDFIGYKVLRVTQQHVGQLVAVFVSAEAKAEGSYANPEQRRFIEQVQNEGGIAGVVRGESDLLKLLASK